jgi:hypothetical protein
MIKENDDLFSRDELKEVEKIGRIAKRAVRKAQEKNRQMGIPNAYELNSKRIYELPDGTLTRDNPFNDE